VVAAVLEEADLAVAEAVAALEDSVVAVVAVAAPVEDGSCIILLLNNSNKGPGSYQGSLLLILFE
jgi:hypothetical protein